MADSSTDEPTPAPETAAEGAESGQTPTNAESAATPETEAASPPPASTAPPPPKPIEIPEALKDCVDMIRATLKDDMDERELVRALKKHVRELKKWPEWSDQARHAYAHLIVADIMHQKAAAICIEHGVDFNQAERAEYDHLLRTMQKRNPR